MVFIRKLLLWSCVIFAAIIVIVYFGMLTYGRHIIQEQLTQKSLLQTTFVYDRHDEPVVALYVENRQPVRITDVPEQLQQAFIAIEDERFADHTGVDIRATGRALLQDFLHMEWVEGGSTITQQLAKNIFLSPEKVISRKMTEWAIAMSLENHYSKEEILEMYLNRIYFGHGSYGVKAAAHYYFGKDELDKLELWEMATLAAIPKSPAAYNPIDHPIASKQRRTVVLSVMLAQKLITEKEAEEAALINYREPKRSRMDSYNKYIDYLLWEANNRAGLDAKTIYENGYAIYTTMDVQTQQRLEDTFRKEKLFPTPGPEQAAQGAMVILNNDTGGIVASAGGRDEVMRGFNRILAPRQPGSVMKPIAVYAPALESGHWHHDSLLIDEQRSFSGYRPKNADNEYEGEVTLSAALRDSKNVPAVWLLEQIGLDLSFNYLAKMGIELTDQERHLSLALGGMSEGVTPLQLAAAYATFAREGEWIEPFAIRFIVDAEGQIVYEQTERRRSVYSSQTAQQMTHMLQAVVQNGTGQKARLTQSVAGKTGSTQTVFEHDQPAYRDTWFVGYTEERTAAVWVGFDRTDDQHFVNETSSWPAQIFAEVMKR